MPAYKYYMVNLNENFKPDKRYTGHLIVSTLATFLLTAIACSFWLIFPAMEEPVFFYIIYIAVGIILAGCIWIVIWAFLYYKSVVYQLNETEMTWKRGVLFRKTGIVPYNRITNVDIVQGPIMRMFKIFHLKIDTAGGTSKDSSEIRIEGIEDPEPLRAMIMDFVRGHVPSPAATGTEYGKSVKTAQAADLQALYEEVAAIRKILEQKK
ncbi:MAG: PH domain-containing protein [Methanocorpusculum sp.]|nr:PH domain-containing protein [Methanocorpusculum sp.]